MTKLISDEYVKLNAELHKQRHGYGNSATRFADDIGKVLHRYHTLSFLDYGCGKESLYKYLYNKFPILTDRADYVGYDPAIPERSEKDPDRIFDMVVSTDVLEHIEPEYLTAVLEDMKKHTGKAIYLNICMRPSGDILPDGRNAHLIVEEADWWEKQLKAVFKGWEYEVRDVLDSWRNYTVVLTRPKKHQPLNIACFYWQNKSARYPGWDNVDLAKTYVLNLFNGVKRNLPNHVMNFILFSNDLEDVHPEITVRKFEPISWTGCFPKLYAHSPESELEGRVLVFDLDTVIVGDLTDFAEYDGGFTTRMEANKRTSGGDLLGFQAGETYQLWENYKAISKYVEKFDGDEREIYDMLWRRKMLFWDDELPGQLVSYKRHVRRNNNKLPENACIVSMHGKPRPHEIRLDWLNKHWWNKE